MVRPPHARSRRGRRSRRDGPGAPAARTVGPAVLLALALGLTGTGLVTLPEAAAATAPLPPPPACATSVSLTSGTVTSPPSPLPAATSTVGGDRLALPGLQADLPPGTPAPPALRATAWLVADLTTGAVLASCNAHVPLAPASTLKILTSLALAHRLDWSARYVGQPADAATDGTRVGIVPGSAYTVGDLFHGLMLDSGNDAATALATAAGGMPVTAAAMNDVAHRLGGLDTTAVNDSGLDAPGQASSAYDLALFGRAALADPLIARLVSTRTYAFPGKDTGKPPRPTFQIQNHNALLFDYPGATGVKNGYTTSAGGSYVGSATRGGHSYLVALLRGDIGTWHLARDLLDWAFAAGPRATPVGRLVDPGEVTGVTDQSGTGQSTAGPSGAGTPTSTARTRSGAALAGAVQGAGGTGSAADTRTGVIVLGVVLTLLLAGTGVAGGRRRATGGPRPHPRPPRRTRRGR